MVSLCKSSLWHRARILYKLYNILLVYRTEMSRDARRSSISITEFTGSTFMFIVGLSFIIRLTFQRLESKTFPITPFTPAKLNIQKFQAHFIPWSKYLIALGSIFSSSVSSLKEKTGTVGAQENVTDGKAFATLSNSITLKPSDESIFDDFDAVVKSETAAAIFWALHCFLLH